MSTSLQSIPLAPSQSPALSQPQLLPTSQQSQAQPLPSPSPPSSVSSSPQSDKSLQDRSSQNSTQPDVQPTYISLKSIKSKQQIEMESRENEEILTNLNFNIDDLFRKISSLTDEITTELQPRLIKERSSPQKVLSPVKSTIPAQQQLTETTNENNQPQQHQNQPQKSSPKPYKALFPQLQQLTKLQSTYKPIFFQPYRPLTPQYSINMKLFQTGKSLGCGKFGQVVQCRNIKTGALFALKKIFKSVIDEYKMEEQLMTQLSILKQLNHPNIVKAYDSFTDDFHIFILMEYVHGPLLVKKLKCSQSQCKVIIKQVLSALKYLHSKKITHRDIKPQNIILTAENVVKICDFGWASQGEQKMNILCGTLDYISPEMAKQSQYTQKSDLWNLGVLTYELIHGYAPFRGSSKSRIFEKVKNLEYEFSEQIQISEECKDFIRGFLREEHERQSIEWGLAHEFLKVIKEEGNKRSEESQQKGDKGQELVEEENIELMKEAEELMLQQ